MPKLRTTAKDVEAQHGRPFLDVLIDVYQKHLNVGGLASELGMTREGLWIEMSIANITIKDLRDAVRQRSPLYVTDNSDT